MAQLHGKQIQNDSVSLNKLNDSGMVTFTNATMSFDSGSRLIQSDVNINDGTDVVNKNYVDSVAQGLHIKDSVNVISLTNISLFGTFSIDDYTLGVGDRVLVNGQDSSNPTSSNGIYVVDSGSWSRSSDSDGISTLNGEVQLGDFVFVAYGSTYSGTGWVLSQSDSDVFNILVGTESQKWTQFSEAGNIIAGDGLIQVGNQFDINVGDSITTGLTISSSILQLTDTGVSADIYGSATEIPQITIDSQGRITSAGTVSITIPTQFEAGIGLTSNGLTLSVDFLSITGAGLTQNGGTISVSVENGLSIDSNSNKIVLGGDLTKDTIISGTGFGFTMSADTIWFTNGTSSSLVVGPDFSAISYDYDGDSHSISANSNGISIQALGGLNNIVLESENELNITATSSLITINNGEGLVYSATPSNAGALTLIHKEYVDNQIIELADVDNLSIILNESNQIQISPTAAGQGLTFSQDTGIIDVIWGGTGSGLTFSGGDSISVNVDETTIQINNDGQLTVVAGASMPIYQYSDNITTSGNDSPTTFTLDYTPNMYSRIEVYVNGQRQKLGDGASSSVDCYFGSTGKSLTELVATDELYWNGLYAGYDLSTDDKVEIIYEK